MVKSTQEESANLHNNVSYCFNRDCSQPENSLDADVCNSCGANLLLQSRYRAIQLIGQGGFGRTFKGIDESKLDKPNCAIKQFWVETSSTTKAKAGELFKREAQRLRVLGKHPHIPALYDYFVEEKEQYLIQEFIRGENLSQEKISNENSIRQLLLDLLPIIQFVHSHKVIHRDLKPENIIRRDRDNSLVLVDFGAAKVVTETTANKTSTVIGSAAYTAPEQLKGKAVFASDIYSLGVTCVYLLTQVHPFSLFDSGENTWNWRHYLSQPVSGELGNILDKMLEGATNKRYQSTSEILKALQTRDVKVRYVGQKLLGVSAAFVLALLGVRALVSPIVQQVSSPTVSSPTIERSPKPITTPHTNYKPGGLYGYFQGKQVQAFALEHTAVDAKIAGNLSRVEVTQTFTNPNDKPLEAIYKFPLPDDAAVDDMEIRVGDRIIRGNIKKKQEAKAIYQQAKREGKTAGLLEQQKDNIFTQSLANIQPGEKVEVVIRYTNTLQFIGSNYEFAFPLVVAPRYGEDKTSNNFNRGRRSDASPAFSRQGTSDPLIAPAFADDFAKTRSGKDINVNIEIDAGVAISKIQSPSHEILVQNTNSTTRVALTNKDIIPNQDLVLRYQLAGAETQATVLTQSGKQGGHFATYLIPAVNYNDKEIVPKDVVFLMDTSGSQRGAAIAQSKELMRQFISGLNENDTFNIIDFASSTKKLSNQPLANTRENRAKALAYVSKIDANGGTQLMNGIDTVLNFPAVEDGRLRSIILLSDGLIGADEQAIAQIRDNLKPGNRLYSFGVGHSTNRFLLDRLAELGRGTVTILPIEEDAVKVAEKFYREINKPVVTNIEIEWLGKGKAPEIYPKQSPDLFASQPLVLYGRKDDASNGKLKITGTVAGGKPYEEILDVNFQQVGGNNASQRVSGLQPVVPKGYRKHKATGEVAIAQLWGRSRIKDLMNQMYGRETPKEVEVVTKTALDYNLLSKYTAFVAVDEKETVKKEDSNNNIKSQSEEAKRLASKPINNKFFTTRESAGIATGTISTKKSATHRIKNRTQKQSTANSCSTCDSIANPIPIVSTPNNNTQSVPEPSEIIGNLLALMLIVLFFTRKRWNHLLKALLQNKFGNKSH